MTYSIRTKDGIEITGIPEGTPKDDPRLRDQVAQMRASGQTSGSFGGAPQPQPTAAPPGQTPPPPPGGAPDPMGQPQGRVQDLVMSPPRVGNIPETAMNMMGGVVRGAGPIAAGALAGGAAGSVVPGVGTLAGAAAGAGAMGLAQMAGDPIIAGINDMFGTKYTMPTDAIEDLFTRIGVAEPKTEAERLVQTVASGTAQAGGSVALGQALMSGMGLSPTTRGLVGQALSSGPLQQILGGAGASAGAGVAAQMGAGPVAQFGAGLAGGALGSAAGNAMLLKPTPAPAIIGEANRAGVPLMTSDVIPPKTFVGRNVQSLSEKIPVIGTGPVRATQQTQRVTAIKDLFRRFGADDAAAASDDVMRDLVTKRADNFVRWENMKDQALETVASTSPDARVTMPRTVKKIDEAIESLRSLNNAAVKPGIDKLIDAKVSFENQTARNVLRNKQILGDVFKSEDLSAVKKIINKELEDTYEAVRLDLTDFIGTAGSSQAKNKWMIANAEETKLFRELDLDIMKNTLEKGGYRPSLGESMEPAVGTRPEVVKNMLFNKDRSVIQALNRNLTARGRASARTAVMQEVAKKVGEDASPEKFVSEIKRLKNSGDPVGVFFSGDDLQAVEGLGRVLKATQRASQAALNPPTGVQAVVPLGVMGGAGLASYFGGGPEGFIGAMGTVGGAGLAARVYESAPVRNILTQIPKVKPGSAEEQALFKRLLEAAQAVQAVDTAQVKPAQRAARESDMGTSR
jgi:hypothetical protein